MVLRQIHQRFPHQSFQIADHVAVEAINNAQRIGERTISKQHLIERSKGIDIQRNKFKLFNTIRRSVSKSKLQVASLKCDVELFPRLYIGCQTREGNLEDIFAMKIRLIHQHCLMVVSYIGNIKVTSWHV